VTSITNANDSTRTQTLGYDNLNRLTSASSTSYGSLAWGYDANGNRTSYTNGSTSITYAITANTNQIASATIGGTAQNLAYDAAGNATQLPANVTGIGTDTATYNDAGHLSVLATPSLSTSYTFNAFRQRTLKSVSGSPTNVYSYGLDGTLLEENDFSAQPFDYVYIDGIPVAEVQAGTIYYQHPDRLGSAYQVTDGTATLVWDIGPAKPFGDDTFVTTAGGFTSNNLRVPGQVADGAYNNNGFRDDIPTLGRYFESDPVGLTGGKIRIGM